MLQALPVKLETSGDEKALLLATMKKYNEAANFLAEQAFRLKIANKVELQKRFYYQLREQFNLSAQFAVRVISKVVEAYKKDKRIKPVFRELGAIQYDQRNLSWKGLDRVSMITLKGRIKLRTRIGEYQKSRADRIRGQADLIYRKGEFYLIAVVDAPEQSEFDPVGAIGVDLGIENIATDSDGQVFRGETIEKARKRYNSLRARLQKKSTRSAKRHLKKMSGREKRFKRDINHVISKAIVSKAKGTIRAIALEDLSGIRSRATVIGRKQQRDRHSKWSFRQLRAFVEYKAKRDGVPVKFVDPKNTSRECPKCHNIDARNRRTRNHFKCTECGYEAMADHVAACNIAARAAVNQPIVAPLFSAVTSPLALAVGS
ncbi:transposase, OrfB family [Candidatus Nitrososphaera gargensis Ga9.2]|uniref:Transposase, OrfB family n=1 Tax=Nitrososphaera gargensis (strain Ga9.2) TaxID=1237085 RepID=K0IBU5_NITGG|nr:RNA-guided endonuclease TnpB family protein [Candidatus Nitrososphaera gargensis]AFU57025.1 transposase, OrfB family [Candidatus Nitrososphaera gargensis Ga9.2]